MDETPTPETEPTLDQLSSDAYLTHDQLVNLCEARASTPSSQEAIAKHREALAALIAFADKASTPASA